MIQKDTILINTDARVLYMKAIDHEGAEAK